MKVPRSGGARDLAWAVGLALGLLAAVLGWIGGQTTKAQALGGEQTHFAAGSVPELRHGTVGPAWASTEPVTRAITVDEMSTPLVWPIPQYGVTVTFPAGWLGPLPPPVVVLTFTPELPAPLPAPVSATSYFFDLRGRYDTGGGEISLSKAITVEIQYDDPGLGSVIESSLRAFWSCCNQRNWVPIETRNGFSRVDAAGNVFLLNYKSLGHIGVGGYRSQVFMPVVLRSGSTAGGLSDRVLQP